MAPFPLASWLQGHVPGRFVFLDLFQSYLIGADFPVKEDFTIANYPGYGLTILSPSLPQTLAPDGSVYADLASMTFEVGRGTDPGNNILGFFLYARDQLNQWQVIHWQVFPEPVNMMEFGKRFTLNVSLYATSYKLPAEL